MEDKATMRIRKPRSDDKPMWDILFGVWSLPAVFVAHDLKLFSLLAERPLTLQEVCNAKGLKRRPAEALLSVVTSLGLERESLRKLELPECFGSNDDVLDQFRPQPEL